MTRTAPSATTSQTGRDPVASLTGPECGQRAYDPASFSLGDMVRCGAALRHLSTESDSMQEAARKVTDFLYHHLRDKSSNERACVLVRLFKTHPYAGLDRELREFASSMAAGAALNEDTRCLTLMASRGEDPRWNSPRTSNAHRAIPLISETMIEQFPMIAQLIRQLGLATADFVRATAGVIQELDQRKFGVFHVPVAAGSPYIPGQKEFVAAYGISSVLGFGGMLPDGDLFVAILFARASIPVSTAEMFRTIALNLKLGLLALLGKPVFSG